MAFYVIAGLGSLILMNKSKKSKESVVIPSAPPRPVSNSFNGHIMSGNFYYGENILKLSDIRIANIHVKAKDREKVKHGKIVISSNDNVIFRETLNNGWINAKGLLVYNSTIRINTKSTKDLEYTIYYM